MSKPTPWNKIKREYLEGASPKDLAKKYKLETKQVSNKAYAEKWTQEEKQIKENLRKSTEEKIKHLTELALTCLEDVLSNEEVSTNDKLNASGKVIEISGLKNQEVKQTIKNIVVASKEDKDTLEGI